MVASESMQGSSIREVAFASFIGTAIEWYDFFLYGTAAALVFARLFFPRYSPLAGTLASFATFGVGFFARPIGGIVFGHFGDRVGRKSMLVTTLLLMGGATFLIGLLPTFEQAGLAAPAALVVLRFVQGFAVGGEWGGATLMVVEHAPDKNRNFYSSWPQLGVPAGLMLSTGAFALFSSLQEQEFLAWGWRVPFLLSAILILVGIFIRLRLLESPPFAAVRLLGGRARVPLIEVLLNYSFLSVLAIGLVIVSATGFYIATTFALSYLTERLHVARIVSLAGLMFFSAAQVAGILIFASAADRIGKRPVAVGSASCLLLLSFPFFWLLNTGEPALIWLAMVSWAFAGSALYSVTGVLLAELFDTRVRYSGISFSYQMGGMLGGAPAPFIATALVHWAHGSSWPVATYLAAASLVTLVAAYLACDRCTVAIHRARTSENSVAAGKV